MRKTPVAQRAVAAALAGMMALGSVAPAIATEIEAQDKEKVGKYVQRYYGEDRYETMAEVVKRTEYIWDQNTGGGIVIERPQEPGIVVASGTSFADSLAANALAGLFKSPLVITDGAKLSEEAADIIEDKISERLQKVYVIGGTAAISDAVVDEIVSIDGVKAGNIERIDGDDRIETSLEIAKKIVTSRAITSGSGNIAIVATGADFADALSISNLSYAGGAPIILTDASGNLSLATKQGLEGTGDFKELAGQFTNFIIVGGDKVVSEDTEDYLKTVVNTEMQQPTAFNLPPVSRWDGKDRYATSEEIATQLAKSFTSEGPQGRTPIFRWEGSVLTTGKNFADALAAGQYAGGIGFWINLQSFPGYSMILLADNVKDPTVETLVDMSSDAFVDKKITVVGGPSAFSDDLATSINDLIKEELD